MQLEPVNRQIDEGPKLGLRLHARGEIEEQARPCRQEFLEDSLESPCGNVLRSDKIRGIGQADSTARKRDQEHAIARYDLARHCDREFSAGPRKLPAMERPRSWKPIQDAFMLHQLFGGPGAPAG